MFFLGWDVSLGVLALIGLIRDRKECFVGFTLKVGGGAWEL